MNTNPLSLATNGVNISTMSIPPDPSDPTTLTARQQAVLRFISDFQRQQAMPPTLLEIAAHFGLASANGVAKHLQALARKGVLELNTGRARGLRLLAFPPHASTRSGEAANPSGTRDDGTDWLSLPVLGRVAAGRPIEAGLASEQQIPLDRRLFRPIPDYLLRVRGDSMIDEGIHDGDLVAIKQQAVAEAGQIVVARVDGEVTIKQLAYRDAGIWLLPRNAAYAPIKIDPGSEFAIEGLYCGLLRQGAGQPPELTHRPLRSPSQRP
jgi:repressor LexA